MKLPNADRAVVDIRKLRDYCLNLDHDEGKHKARLFVAALGMTTKDAEALQQILLDAATRWDVEVGRTDEYGQRYRLDFVAEWKGRRATIRSAWIVVSGEDVPRLTSCYPMEMSGG